jgi:hypothetical protein
MKPIKFLESNAGKINTILAGVNGPAVGHVYYSYQDFAGRAARKILAAKDLVGGDSYTVGIKISIESGVPVSKSYKYVRIGTRLTLERRASGWFITEISRCNIWPSGGQSMIIMTPEHHDRAVTVLKRGYLIENT